MTVPVPKTILVVDDSKYLLDMLAQVLQQEGYDVHTASNGEECLSKVASLKPQLVLLELLLPKIQGLDCLRQIRHATDTAATGVIIVTRKALVQDYETALEAGANYYLIKPFTPDELLAIIQQFFQGTLKPAPFADISKHLFPSDTTYNPQIPKNSSYIRFWGTRGSIPVAGVEYHRHGGNTVCLEIRQPEHLIILDAGTGIRPLGPEVLASGLKEIHLFIGHTHWDHIIGFPFFAPVYDSSYKIHIYGAKGFGKSLEELFTGMLDRDYFPVKLDEMQAELIFHTLTDETPVKIGDVEIGYAYASHHGVTLCFKITSKDQTIGYVTDNEMLAGYHGHPSLIEYDHPLLDPHRPLIEFLQGCDTIVHEAQYSPEEYLKKVGWGHSSSSNASVLIKYAGCQEWVLSHYDPGDTDTKLMEKLKLHQVILKECDIPCRVRMAYDGLMMSL